MKDTRNNRPSNSGSKPFGRRKNFGQGIMGDDPQQMYSAVCDNCGKRCEVPFKPSNGKPVYCSNCFRTMRDDDPKRSYDHDSRSSDREMFQAVCDSCGKRCEVPFRPSSSKPVYCKDCFEGKTPMKKETHERGDHNGDIVQRLTSIESKLDKLLSQQHTKHHNEKITTMHENTDNDADDEVDTIAQTINEEISEFREQYTQDN